MKLLGQVMLTLFHYHLQVLAAHLDGVQRLVQFVSHTGRHLPESRHFAGLNELLLGHHPCRNIPGRDEQNFPLRVLGR